MGFPVPPKSPPKPPPSPNTRLALVVATPPPGVVVLLLLLLLLLLLRPSTPMLGATTFGNRFPLGGFPNKFCAAARCRSSMVDRDANVSKLACRRNCCCCSLLGGRVDDVRSADVACESALAVN